MTDPSRLEKAWVEHRRRVLDLAYRMLGSVAEAEDVAQEAFSRLMQQDLDAIEDVRGWLVTVTSRLCLDHLRSARVLRRAYVGPWFPEPIVDFPADSGDPADRVTLDESVRMALLVLLERLSPAERVAFILHDIFQTPFEEVGAIVGRSAEACRQLASRARRHIRSEPAIARFGIDQSEHRRLVEQFSAACNDGSIAALAALLDPDAIGEFDSGGSIRGAPTAPVTGTATIARLLMSAFAGVNARFMVAMVNGEPGVVAIVADRIVTVISFVAHGQRIVHIRALGNPAKLSLLSSPPKE